MAQMRSDAMSAIPPLLVCKWIAKMREKVSFTAMKIEINISNATPNNVDLSHIHKGFLW
jgi:hypothetical protein